MIAARVGRVDAPPAEQLRAPGDVGILAVDEEIGVEELAVDAKCRRSSPAGTSAAAAVAPKTYSFVQVVSVVDFLAAAIEVPQHRSEVDSSRIDQWLVGNSKCLHRQQLAANRADSGFDLAASTSAWMKFGSSRTSGFRVSIQSPLGNSMAWFCAAAKPIFSEL